MKTAVPLKEVIAGFAPARQKRIKARAKELIAEEMALRDIRKSRALTQDQVAKRLGGKQVYVSRLESRSDVKVSTLRNYVHALRRRIAADGDVSGRREGEGQELGEDGNALGN